MELYLQTLTCLADMRSNNYDFGFFNRAVINGSYKKNKQQYVV
jgi:hypothetical protein